MDTAFFVLSKLVGLLLKVEIWLLALAGLAVWAGWRGRVRLQQGTCLALFLALLGIGVLPLGDVLLRPSETGYARPDAPDNVDGIIILGGAEDLPASRQSAHPELGEGGDRYIAALALAERYPGARILFAGGSGRLRDVSVAEITEAAIARQIFLAQGIAPERLLFEDRSRNTVENARLSRVLASPGADEQWVLITSAFHMPRAVRSFSAAGWTGILPWPVDFRTRARSDGLGWHFHRNLGLINMALREAVGRSIYAATGR